MPRSDEDTCRTIAEQINQARPQWLVVWGGYTHRFWALALFEMRPRMLVHAGYPDALVARMDEAERRYRIRDRPEEMTDDDTDTR